MFAMADGAPPLFQVLGNSDALHGQVEVSGMQPCEGAAGKTVQWQLFCSGPAGRCDRVCNDSNAAVSLFLAESIGNAHRFTSAS